VTTKGQLQLRYDVTRRSQALTNQTDASFYRLSVPVSLRKRIINTNGNIVFT